MNRITSLGYAVALFAFVSLAPLATAQPGPVPGSGGGAPTAQPFAVPGQLSPEAMATYLRNKGHKVTETKATDGRPILVVQIMDNGWKFDVDIEFYPNLQGFYISCPLSKANAPMSAAQLTALLKGNYTFPPDYFTIRGNDQRLALETNCGARMNTEFLQMILNRFLGNVRRSQNLWDSSYWPAGALQPAQIAPKM